MNKKIVTLILIIVISFCFISIVVADNVTHDDNNATDDDDNVTHDDNDTTDHGKTSDKDKDDKNKKKDKDKTDDKSKKNYILAKGSGNNIKFSDGFRGFILDYSKHPASSGDKFKHVSTSKASNSNELKLAIIEYYKLYSTGDIAKIISDVVKTGSASGKVGEAVEASHEKVGDHEVVKIDNHTEAVFDFEVLKSVSGNESDYFAYKVSFKNIEEEHINQTNLTNTTNTTNKTNKTNITAIAQPDNGTNSTFLQGLYDYLAALANSLFDAWKPIIDSLINDFLMIINALEELAKLFEDVMAEIQSLIDAIGKFLELLQSLWEGLDGLFKLLAIILTAIQQLMNFIGQIVDFIMGLVSAIISLVQQLLGLLQTLIDFIMGIISELLGLLQALIDFIMDLINQIISFIQAILAFLASVGSFLINVIENAVIIIASFVIITIGAFIYNRIR